ncbi:hypothetical protein F5878DRAFT_664735 [Lentinula raphanica]|uniref:Uncharacterized protein n=1 Tax=Lentinula raphanica TaxID=153919 RepID=A0AA38U953_9AGAR|nr:hypothetical protein F5878DRAFT_664735 [Lentinula raphanica]
MSRFIVSFSREETEAALAYYSSHAEQFPPLVSGFFQTLLNQFSNKVHSANSPQETSFHSTSTDSPTALQMKTTNVFHETTMRPIHAPRRSQTIRPSLVTPSPSPPRMFPEDERLQMMPTSPNHSSQTTLSPSQTEREGFSLPASSPSAPRIFQDTNLIQSGVEETRLPSLELVTCSSGH